MSYPSTIAFEVSSYLVDTLRSLNILLLWVVAYFYRGFTMIHIRLYIDHFYLIFTVMYVRTVPVLDCE
jgi:predicted Co/Zn/Cd cation transporter (cation efflux family)